MENPSLSSALDHFLELSPLVWIGGFAVAAAAVIAGAFAFYVLLLLPFALAKGEIGVNARAVLKDLLGLFHALIRCVGRRGRRR